MSRMIVTKEEAKTKLCPMAATILESNCCIADACMAWVEHKEDDPENFHPSKPHNYKGYCGMVRNEN